MTGRALLLDFGGVVLVSPFERRAAAEAAFGLPPGALPGGPFDPAGDLEWRAVVAGERTERSYWQRRADEVAAATGRAGMAVVDLLRPMYDAPEADLVRPAGRALVRSARAAGVPVAILTNDLRAFHPAAWVEQMTILGDVDTVVDGSVTGILKPDPRAFAAGLAAVGAAAGDVVFVDDMAANIAGGAAAGLQTVAFDVTRPDVGFAEAARLLGLDRETPAGGAR